MLKTKDIDFSCVLTVVAYGILAAMTIGLVVVPLYIANAKCIANAKEKNNLRPRLTLIAHDSIQTIYAGCDGSTRIYRIDDHPAIVNWGGIETKIVPNDPQCLKILNKKPKED